MSDIAGRVRRTGKAEFSSSKLGALLALPLKGDDGSYFYVIGDIPFAAFGPHPPPPPGPPPGMGPPPLLFGPGLFPPPGPPFSTLRLFITLMISGIVCYLLARYLTSPIVRLRDATRRLAGGELTVRIGKGTTKWKDELSELAGDFDSMAEHIATLVTQQRQLIRDISHELRSPLARLTIAAELLKKQSGGQSPATLERIEREIIVLNEMIGQVLAITRFESDTEMIRMDRVDLKELLEDIIDDANYEANVLGSVVRFVESESCMITGNEKWLRRAVENVIRNAVRYTHVGTNVEVRLVKIRDDSTRYAEISVRDHGNGVPEKDLSNIFRPFYRVSDARERQTGGTGLGLAIAERAVGLHNGSISSSNSPEGGLKVIIRLPLSQERSAK